ncbi:MAG: hypothetical protein F9K24_10255 [Leptonema illini]|nr:hypothetical protein [Leptonema illini]KAB2932751.1 MAG: hypothetical protein F9K24_10255 [Leptonema illini]
MRIFNRFRPALAALPLLLIIGCASASAGIATSNVPLGNREYEILGTAETSTSWWSVDLGIIGLPLDAPPVDAAVQKLLSEKGGDALVNLRYSTDRSIFLFMTRHRFHLKADVVKLKPEPARRR